jgi:hypothetical protein
VQGPAVEPGYALPDGRTFADIDGYTALVLADERQIARNLVGKLAAHLTGAEVEFADRDTVEAILDRTASGGHGVRSLLEEVIRSRLFTHK